LPWESTIKRTFWTKHHSSFPKNIVTSLISTTKVLRIIYSSVVRGINHLHYNTRARKNRGKYLSITVLFPVVVVEKDTRAQVKFFG
jgi:hypothetical protein